MTDSNRPDHFCDTLSDGSCVSHDPRCMHNMPWSALAELHDQSELTRKLSGETEQPPPTLNDSTPIWELVIADMHERDNVGRARYGVPLQAFNGRDALVDAYQESLDQVVYLRQALVEFDAMKAELAKLKAGQK